MNPPSVLSVTHRVRHLAFWIPKTCRLYLRAKPISTNIKRSKPHRHPSSTPKIPPGHKQGILVSGHHLPRTPTQNPYDQPPTNAHNKPRNLVYSRRRAPRILVSGHHLPRTPTQNPYDNPPTDAEH